MGNNNQPKSFANVLLDVFNNPKLMSFIIGIVVFLIFALLMHFKALNSFELITLEWRFKHFHSQAHASDNCVILGIDKKSVEDLGTFPWSRDVYADLVEALEFYGVKSIAFDLFFSVENKKNPEGDAKFAEVVSKYDNIVIASPVVNELKTDKTKSIANQLERFSLKSSNKLKNISVKNNYADILSKEDLASQDYVVMPLVPYQALFKAVKSLGIISFASEGSTESSKIFKVPLVLGFEGNSFPVLSLDSYLLTLKNDVVKQLNNAIGLGNGKSIPTIGDNLYVVNWYPAKEARGNLYRNIPVSDLLNAYRALKRVSNENNLEVGSVQDSIDYYYTNECDSSKKCDPEKSKIKLFIDDENEYEFLREELKDKYVFVGLIGTFAGSKDLVQTPLLGTIPGVFMHANIVDNFLQDDYIHKVSILITLVVMLVLVLATTVSVLAVKNPVVGISASLVYWLYFLVPLMLFEHFNIWADLFYTEVAVILAFCVSLAYQWKVADQDKKLLKSVFSNYLAPQVLTEVLSDPSKVKMGGNKKDITVLFSDIRGFTSISEANTPEGVVEFLNEYFDAMVEEIMKTDGTVDKFIGDAIMAFWGAPVERENHAELAIKGSLGMLKALEDLKARWKDQGREIPEINIGIGLNTGEAIVGHVGSTKVKSYTVIGDSVNLASRLEGLNKTYADCGDPKQSIIISEFTYEHVKDIFDVLYLDEVKVKGKNIAVKIYKVLGYKGE